MNYYCYDPVTSQFTCLSRSTFGARRLDDFLQTPTRDLQEYIDDRFTDPERFCEDETDKFVCNNYNKQSVWFPNKIDRRCFAQSDPIYLTPEQTIFADFYPLQFFKGSALDGEVRCLTKI